MSIQLEKKRKSGRLTDKIVKKKKRNYKRYIDGFLLISIGITSINIVYITVPIFLSVIFFMFQIKVYVDNKQKRED